MSDRTLDRLFPPLLVAVALALRVGLFGGFALGDDWEFHWIFELLVEGKPVPSDRLHLLYRFPIWMFNWLSQKALGGGEAGFFLPTVLISGTFPALGYFFLRRWNHAPPRAFLGALAIAAAPFEVLLGTVCANDVYLAWFIALTFAALELARAHPRAAGTAAGAFFWLGFYSKLWIVFVAPALGFQMKRNGGRKTAAAFAASSLAFHACSALFWKWKLGMYFPFLHALSATYPVHESRRWSLWAEFPAMVLRGSEFGDTFFGAIPCLVGALLAVKASRRALRLPLAGFDRADALLALWYGSFFIALNFASHNFRLDGYYSVPRIFRYLAPISFPLSLHAAKLLLEAAAALDRAPLLRGRAGLLLMTPALALGLSQAVEATAVSRSHRGMMKAVASDLRAAPAPRLLAEAWVAYFLRAVHLKNRWTGEIGAPGVAPRQDARDYEAWLSGVQPKLPAGALLLTGLGSYTHYGCRRCGFQLSLFERPLDARWRLVKDYGPMKAPRGGEPVRLWRLAPPARRGPS